MPDSRDRIAPRRDAAIRLVQAALARAARAPVREWAAAAEEIVDAILAALVESQDEERRGP